MEDKTSSFIGDTQFCSECGSILPLPGSNPFITCIGCGFKFSIKIFDGITIDYEIKYNNKDNYKRRKENEKNTDDSSGPLVDKVCAKCGHQGMTYSTLQTRSADEGQTVFYSCTNCKYQEHENS